MTTTQQGGASPVDFETFGDYGDFKRKQPDQAAKPEPGEFVRPAYPFRGRITADGSSGHPARPRPEPPDPPLGPPRPQHTDQMNPPTPPPSPPQPQIEN